MEVPAVSWLTAKAEVRRSPIEGLGLVAREPVAEGRPSSAWAAGLPVRRATVSGLGDRPGLSAAGVPGGVRQPLDPTAAATYRGVVRGPVAALPVSEAVDEAPEDATRTREGLGRLGRDGTPPCYGLVVVGPGDGIDDLLLVEGL